jgi:hypothetical protein
VPTWQRYTEEPASGNNVPTRDWHGAKATAQELWAGTARLSAALEEVGFKVSEPVELYEDPARKKGVKPHHNLLDSAVQEELLRSARGGEHTVWWMGFPCSSFCAWNLRNGGTRTTGSPEGSEAGPQWEQDGTAMANFAARLFACAKASGSVVVAENTAPDGRYPKAWDLPAWRKILRSRDVHVVPLEMCQYDLRPESGHGFHRKRTWLVTNAPGLQALMRKCPNTHTHVPMEGRAPGAAQPRTAAAGQYTHAFARAAAEVLATTAAHCNARLGGGP